MGAQHTDEEEMGWRQKRNYGSETLIDMQGCKEKCTRKIDLALRITAVGNHRHKWDYVGKKKMDQEVNNQFHIFQNFAYLSAALSAFSIAGSVGFRQIKEILEPKYKLPSW